MTDIAHLACTYAALILYDDGQDITGDKISALVNAAGLKIEPYWPKLFAKAVEGQNIASFFSLGSDSAGPSSAVVNPTASKVAVQKQQVKQVKKVEEKKGKKEVLPPPKDQQEDVGMGGLFD